MPELDAEHRDQMARAIGRVRDPADHSPNCWDGSPCRYCTDDADGLAPLVAGWIADAWQEGYEAGSDDTFPTRNPYRGREGVGA